MSFKLDIAIDFISDPGMQPITVKACSATAGSGITALVLVPSGAGIPRLILEPPIQVISRNRTEDSEGAISWFYVLYVPPTVLDTRNFHYQFTIAIEGQDMGTKTANGTIDVSGGGYEEAA
ncbi:hypothetical protein [Corallococcus carmarthensis]|uniref:Uncharacterized protein n=1 Tax=Corallococcus carmarthensis TaxID=2316728 RepID=A0A3A8KIN3_9BACT|nr:hypothetical protein [Corallococcus carmarthensis]NOK17126.1 hypothetical protein [Corallococcus carmarthensis]RKH04051.1 hypothetical protein D7X32_12295 [Corallococcus carmarthensis]